MSEEVVWTPHGVGGTEQVAELIDGRRLWIMFRGLDVAEMLARENWQWRVEEVNGGYYGHNQGTAHSEFDAKAAAIQAARADNPT